MTGESQGSLRSPITRIQYDLAQGTDAHLVPHHLLPISSPRFQSLLSHNRLNHVSYSLLRTPQLLRLLGGTSHEVGEYHLEDLIINHPPTALIKQRAMSPSDRGLNPPLPQP